MVRPRIQLERLSGELSRDHYYLHNKSIVSKKVQEMSVLTGADVLFIGFSPSGVPTIHLGDNRRHDNIQTLKANYQKEEGYNIEVEKLFDAWKLKKFEEEIIMNMQKFDAEKFAESAIEPFEEYIPDMLSGNEELLGYANILMSRNEASTSKAQQW
ncbi:hypothetical protein RND81_01G224200 [Saponaria officinalis]|uniref:MADS-box domain-containing protein n=1 Tax=Saponaria officinalis TaxID=3572 RepID=A0AAW1NK91_SAPOF